jgi:hypothetical protein
MLPSVRKTLMKWRRLGVTSPAVWREAGARGSVKVERNWTWPLKGYLFPSRRGANHGHLCKDTICRGVAEVRGAFVEKHRARFPSLDDKTVRTHSGRRHTVSWMDEDGVKPKDGQEFAQIECPRIYQRYVDADPLAVGHRLTTVDRRNPLGSPLKRRRG